MTRAFPAATVNSSVGDSTVTESPAMSFRELPPLDFLVVGQGSGDL
jgi:hypothetical protein